MDTTERDHAIADMERRMQDVFRLITERRVAGIDVSALEELWLYMLTRYEARVSGRESEAA